MLNQKPKEEKHRKKQLSLHSILLSLIGFIVLWAIVTDAWGYSEHFFRFYAGTYIYALISRLIWVFPAILLIIRYRDSLPIRIKELFSPPRFDKPLLLVLTVSSAIVAITMLFYHKGFWFNHEVNPLLEIIKFMMVGCVEEIVFRGWGYHALTKVTSERKAVILSTGLFILLHLPAYFIKFYRFGTFDFAAMLIQSFSALLWGIVFCWLTKKGKTLWNPILAHAFYDWISVLFVG